MRKFIKFLFLSLLILTGYQKTDATHVMGSDIVYRCLGNGQYEVIVRVYRDCNGVQLSQSNLVARCSSNTVTISNQTKVSQRDITGIDARCPIQSRCSGSYQYGVEEHIWKMTLDLSNYNCCEWTLSWEQCCRNSNISTGQADQNFFTTATLNKCVTPCNSSPDFTNPPVAIICANQDFVFNNGALDTLDSGDSLSYELAAGLQGLGSQVTYLGQFSPTRPLTFFGFPNQNLSWPAGFRLDPTTGDLLFRPTQVNQVAVVVIEVKEWRKINGVMTVIGITRRDMQVIVVACPNNKIPRILPPYSKQACAGQQVCIPITTIDDDLADTVRISWNRGIPGATFTNNNGSVKHASGEVCWTPNESHVSNIPYTFTITARDNACPLAGQGVRAFSIFVRDTPKSIRNLQVLNCGKVAIRHTPVKNYTGLTFTWTIRDSLNRVVYSSTNQTDTAFLQPGVHRVFLVMQTSTPCINIHIDSIIVPEFVQVTIPDTFICDGIPVNLVSRTRNGNIPYEYQWSQLTDTTPLNLDTTTNMTVNPDTNSRYVLRVKDGNGCYNWDTSYVAWNALPEVNLGPDQRVCTGTAVSLTNIIPATKTFRYLWNTGDTSSTVSVTDSNGYWLRVMDSLGCYKRDTMVLRVNNPKPELGPNRTICERDTITLTVNGADTYNWYNLSGFTLNPLPTPVASGPSYTYIVTSNGGWVVRGVQTYQNVTCFGFDTINVSMNPLPAITFDPKGPHCPDAGPINLVTYLAYPTLLNGTWSSTQRPTAVNNGLFYPDISGSNSVPGWAVTYNVVDNRGCRNSAVTNVRVSPLPAVSIRDSIAICADAGDLSLNDIKLQPITTVGLGTPEWYSLDNLSLVNSNIIKTNIHNQQLRIGNLPQGGIYHLVFKFTNTQTGCTGYDTGYVRVKAIPKTDAGVLPPVCWSDDTVTLSAASGANPSGGFWSSPDMPLTFGNTSYNPSDIGSANQYHPSNTNVKFYYTVVEEGCSRKDSVIGIIRGIPNVQLTPLAGICDDSSSIDLSDRSNWSGHLGGLWEGNGISGTIFDPLVAGVGFHTLKFTYTHPSTGCKNESSFITEVQAKPRIMFTAPGASCIGLPFELKVDLQNAGGIQWSRVGDGEFESKGSGLSTTTQNPTHYYPGSGDNASLQFRIMGETTNPRYCQPARLDQQINIYPIPTIGIDGAPLTGCQPLEVDFEVLTNAAQGLYLDWDFGNGRTLSGRDNVRKLTETYTEPGTFTVNLKIHSDSSFGYCEADATPIRITVHPTPVADMDANRWKTTVALPGIQFYDKSTIGIGSTINSWVWSFGDRNNSISTAQNPFFEYPSTQITDTGLFPVTLRVQTPEGCWDTTTRYVRIDPDITVFIPNAFSPNSFGDTINNKFYIIARDFSTFQINIFNRWGEMVYNSNDINKGWDGTYKGKAVQQDVYVYIVKITSILGKEYEFWGTVTLLR